MPLLLDEMLSDTIARRLRRRGRDVAAVVEDLKLRGAPDEVVLRAAADAGRALVTLNIRDFLILDRSWRSAAAHHAGIVAVPSSSFAQDGSFIGALVRSLDRLLKEQDDLAGRVVFLQH